MLSLSPLFLLPILSCIGPPTIEAANILGLFCSTSPSHLIVHMSVAKILADHGHNLTVITSIESKIIHENITNIVIPPSEEFEKEINEHMSKMAGKKNSMVSTMFQFFSNSQLFLEYQYKFLIDERLLALYDDSNTKFDLLLYGYFLNTIQLGVAAKLNIPTVMNWVGVPMEMIDTILGNVRNPAYVRLMCNDKNQNMNFLQRLQNFLLFLFYKLLDEFLDFKLGNLYNVVFANETNFPSYYDMKKRISLVFYNYHSFTEGPIRPTVPQSIEVGGVQVKEQPDPLPKHIADFLDSSTEGAIYFSLGTNIKGSYINSQIIVIIYNVLKTLKQTVIWKWEDLNHIPGNATNILYDNWLPQDDILAHPNIKLFITHAGKGGITESLYHGVPMLALPVFGDQPANAAQLENSGFGLNLDLLTLKEQEFQLAVNELLNNSKYTENARKFSKLYRDRPLSCKQSIIYWTEYVLRHNGALHLQSPLVHMNFIESNNLDIYAILLIVFLALISIFKFLTKLILDKWFFKGYTRKSYQQVTTTQNKLKLN